VEGEEEEEEEEEEEDSGYNKLLPLSSHNPLLLPLTEIDLTKDSIKRINLPSGPAVRSPIIYIIFHQLY
jgi:hypothetical protein